MSSQKAPLDPQVQVIKPDRTNYRIGITVLPIFALASAVFTGWLAAISFRHAHGSDFFVIMGALTCWIGVMSFALTNAANMMSFGIRLSSNAIQVRSLLQSYDISVSEIHKVCYIHNFRYQHVMLQTGKGNIIVSSLLWSNEVFAQFVRLFLSWCSDKGVYPALDFDNVSKLNAEQKAANRSLEACLRRDWGSYFLALILLVAVCYAGCRGLNVG